MHFKQRGSFAIEGAFVFVLFSMLFTIVATFLLAWHTEELNLQAARTAAHVASLVMPIADTQSLAVGQSVTCGAPNGAVVCNNSAVLHPESFTTIFNQMKIIDPRVTEDRFIIHYQKTEAVNMQQPTEHVALITVELNSANLLSLVPGLSNFVAKPARVTAIQQMF